MTRFVMPGLMALALILIGLNYAFDHLRTAEKPVTALTVPMAPTMPRPSIGFRLGGQPSAVYRVQLRLGGEAYGIGTAFLVDAQCGVFATNAHVAEPGMGDFFDVVLVEPQSGKPLTFKGMRFHPARAALFELYDTYAPIGQEPTAASSWFVPPDPLDVALFTIGEASATSPNGCKLPTGVTLPQPIPLADSPATQGLQAGTAAAIIHYPGTGNRSDAIPTLEATARVEFGTLRALGSSLPVALPTRGKTPLFEDYLYLSVEVVGGSSGGVVLGPSGDAIGLVAEGTSGTDRGTIYQETIAFPARIISETSDPNPAALVASYLDQAKIRLTSYLTAPAFLIKQLQSQAESEASRLGASAMFGQPRSSQIVQTGLSNSLCSGGSSCIVASDLNSPFPKGWFTRVSVPLDTNKINYVGAIDIDLTAEPSSSEKQTMTEKSITHERGICPIALALLRPKGGGKGGYAVLQTAGHESMPHILVPATFAGQQTLDLLIYRPSFCSDKFLKAHVVVMPFTVDTRAPAQTSALESVMRAANKAMVTFGEAAAPPLWRED